MFVCSYKSKKASKKASTLCIEAFFRHARTTRAKRLFSYLSLTMFFLNVKMLKNMLASINIAKGISPNNALLSKE